MKNKAFFIIFKGLSIKQRTQFFLEGESPTSNSTFFAFHWEYFFSNRSNVQKVKTMLLYFFLFCFLKTFSKLFANFCAYLSKKHTFKIDSSTKFKWKLWVFFSCIGGKDYSHFKISIKYWKKKRHCRSVFLRALQNLTNKVTAVTLNNISTFVFACNDLQHCKKNEVFL